TSACELPLLVDIDTGWGGAFNIARTIRAMEKAGAAAVHLEDQVAQKRCGHRPNKAIVSQAEMVDRVKAAVDARVDADCEIMARTVRAREKASAAAVQLEDQVAQKRCGHRPNKAIVSQAEMVDRVKAGVDARVDADFVIMARTDALAVEGIESAIERAVACVEAGAGGTVPEGMAGLAKSGRGGG